MITPGRHFRQQILRDGNAANARMLLRKQRREVGLLRTALSGYASQYDMNIPLQRVRHGCDRMVRG
jgi:hypothetical protein